MIVASHTQRVGGSGLLIGMFIGVALPPTGGGGGGGVYTAVNVMSVSIVTVLILFVRGVKVSTSSSHQLS